MKILDKDLSEIDNLYDKFIKMMIESFNNNYGVNIQNALSFINQIYKDLIVTNKREKYPIIDYIKSLGVYSLYGFQVCRTTNNMLYDFMKGIGLDVTLKTVFIDDNGDWHIVKPIIANHVVVNMKEGKINKYFDLYNDLFVEKDNGKISTIEVDNKRVKIDYSKYEEIISRISDILDRYLLLEKLGIEKVYEY